MENIFNNLLKKDTGDYEILSNTFCKYLGFENSDKLYEYNQINPKIWGKGYEFHFDTHSEAWEQKEMYFSHEIIIKKLESIYNNLIKQESKKKY